ncbi:hypothetical protein Tco_0773267 [Tanacetum coccineum]|uniref:Uncharacterized protein n=1 Tax=Tanacetum coccineum TaxID=301880 RepID=A0ABQ4ZMV4_9ASTR
MRSNFTTINFESVRSIKSETFVEDDNLNEIDYDLFLYDSESCEFNRLLCIDPDIFSYEIDVQESYKEIVHKITNMEKDEYSAPQEKREHCNKDSKREKLEWANLSLNDWMRIRYGKVCKMTGERILKDFWKERLEEEEDDSDKNLEDQRNAEKIKQTQY